MVLMTPLGLFDTVKEISPVGDRGRNRVKFDTVDEREWSGVNTFASSVLPDLTDLPGSVMSIIWTVYSFNILGIEAKFICNLL